MNTTRTRMHRGDAAIVVRRKHRWTGMHGVQGRRPDSHSCLSPQGNPRNLNDLVKCQKCESTVPLRKMDAHRRTCFNII